MTARGVTSLPMASAGGALPMASARGSPRAELFGLRVLTVGKQVMSALLLPAPQPSPVAISSRGRGRLALAPPLLPSPQVSPVTISSRCRLRRRSSPTPPLPDAPTDSPTPRLRLPDDSPALRRLPRSPIPRLPDFPTPRLPDSPAPLPVSDSPTPRLPDSPTRRLPVVAASSAQAGLSLSLSRCLPALAKIVSLNRCLWRGAGHCQDGCLHRCVAG